MDRGHGKKLQAEIMVKLSHAMKSWTEVMERVTGKKSQTKVAGRVMERIHGQKSWNEVTKRSHGQKSQKESPKELMGRCHGMKSGKEFKS